MVFHTAAVRKSLDPMPDLLSWAQHDEHDAPTVPASDEWPNGRVAERPSGFAGASLRVWWSP